MRKHYIFVLSLCLLGSTVAYSQIDRPNRVEIGIIAGPTVDWAVSNVKSHTPKGAKLGGVYGLNVDLNIVPTYSNYFFSTGINARHIHFGLEYKTNYLYENLEAAKIDTFNNATVKSTFNTVYVSIPTAIRLKTNSFNNFVFWGLVGLDHSIAVSSKSNDEITLSEGGKKKQDKVNQYKSTAIFKESLYIVLGAEYYIQDKTKFLVGLGYDYGFNNMFRKKHKNVFGETINVHTHRIEIQFGITF
ncbi:MAG: PorT family protein [Bacteroidales bacterium]|nr:PorT family protein [Bacteroidales bacterium]